MTARVIVAGDANLDLVLRGDVVPRFGQAEQLLTSADLVLGSSAGICASGLARLGLDVSLVARVGRDVFGDQTVRLLANNGVNTDQVLRTDAPTGVSVILSGVDDRSILTLTGAMAMLTVDDVRQALLGSAGDGDQVRGHLHVASLFLLPDLCAALPELLADVRSAGFTTSLDTNWDPDERWTGVEACLPHLDVFLPNATEAMAITRSLGAVPENAETAARMLADRGPIVAVKDGARGGFAVAGEQLVQASGLAVDVVDTTGAGDSFDAGFLSGWLAGEDLPTALRWGTAAGSLSTLGAGGTGAQPSAAELSAALASSGPGHVR